MDLPIVKSIRRKTDVKVVEVGRKLLKKQKRRGKVKLSSKNDATVNFLSPSMMPKGRVGQLTLEEGI